MTDDLASLDATGTAALIRTGEVSALEVVDAAIARAEAAQPDLNFLTTDLFEAARARAGAPLAGPFAGVPYLVKDMFDVAGAPTRWGARFGPFMPPAEANSTQVNAMEAAGLVVIGKTALGEMGFLPTTEPLVSGPTRNPWNRDMSTGGSSGGSAAAVAAGVVPMADAADGGGSIRIPASACGLFGLKPSRGALVGEQNPAAGYPLTTEHCVSHTVRDSAGLFAAMAASPFPPVAGPSSTRLRIGLITTSLSGLQPAPEVAAAVEATGLLLEKLGHRVEPGRWTFDTTTLLGDFSILYASAALEVVGLVRGILGSEPDETVLEPFTLGMAAFAAALAPDDLDRAKETLGAIPYDSAFADYDVILSPVLLTPTVPIGHITGDVPFDVCLDRLSHFADYTILHNIAGAPAMSVPLGLSPDGIPIGSQFSGPVGSERMLFELASELEEAQPFTRLSPPSS